MIYYDHLPLSEDILEALSELKIEYVFQSIFLPDGKTVYAREALMRPVEKNVLELIDEYTKLDKLHVLEVATFYGATQAYFMRGYTEKLSVNSFPCESFTEEETLTYMEYFGKDKNILIVELLEYPRFSLDKSIKKRQYVSINDNEVALDDFGAGFNNQEMVDLVKPHIVKIDRALLTDIDKDQDKQINCKSIIDRMHACNIKVVAEGVETKEEFDCLVNLGADLFQGYYLERPA